MNSHVYFNSLLIHRDRYKVPDPKRHLSPLQTLAPSIVVISVSFLFIMFSLLWSRTEAPSILLNMDDTYIHIRLAQNFADHGVLSINPNESGGGSSSFGWTLLLVLASFLHLPMQTTVLSLSIIGGLISAWILGQLASRRLPFIGTICVAVLIGLSGYAMVNSLSGMETTCAVACVLFALDRLKSSRYISGTIFLATASLFRPEMCLAGIAVAVFPGDSTDSVKRFSPAHLRLILGPFAISVLAAILGVVLLAAMGHGFPQTLAGRRFLAGASQYPWTNIGDNIRISFTAISWLFTKLANDVGPGRGAGILWALIVVPLMAISMFRAMKERSVLAPLTLFLLLYLAFYFMLLPIPGQMGRYWLPFWLLIPLFVTDGWYLVKNFAEFRKLNWLPVSLSVVLLLGYLPQMIRWPQYQRSAIAHLENVHYEMAKSVAQLVPPNETVAAFDIGILSQYSNHRIFDLGGLTDRAATNALYNGHMQDLLNERGIRYIVLPELFEPYQWSLAERLSLTPASYRRIASRRLQPGETVHLQPTLVAYPVLTLYEIENALP